MGDFEYRFLWKEFPQVVPLLELDDMAIVCHHALAQGQLVRFTMDHVVRFIGISHVYFSEELPAVGTTWIGGTKEFPHGFHTVDVMRVPEHFDLNGAVPYDGTILPRLRFSLPDKFTSADSSGVLKPSERLKDFFRGIRDRLSNTGVRVTHEHETVIASRAAVDAVRAGTATSARAALDELLKR